MAVTRRMGCRVVIAFALILMAMLILAFCVRYGNALFRPMFHNVFVEAKMSPCLIWKTTMPIEDSSNVLMYCDYEYNMVAILPGRDLGASVGISPHDPDFEAPTLLRGSGQEVVVERRDHTLQVFRDGELRCAVPLKAGTAQNWSRRMNRCLYAERKAGSDPEIRQKVLEWYSGPDRDRLKEALAELQE